MPRTGPRRVTLATKILEADLEELDAIAEQAGVTRADVARSAVEVALRGVDRERLVAYLAEVGKEAPSGSLDRDRRGRLLG
jgi:hypothetical protein